MTGDLPEDPGRPPVPSDGGPSWFGKYELLEMIGSGGMAEIFKARLSGLGGFEKILVVKKILPHYAKNRSFVKMLIAEAKLCSSLQHANIVQIFELGEVDENPYIAMEYVHGKDLLKLLSRRTKMGERMPIELCLYMVAEVCKGLGYAHEATDPRGNPLKIIHRDVSPSNVIISYNGEVKITDFGVAKASLEQEQQHTRPGVLKGKLGYMSPEQVTGRDFDHRSDIFSLGIILYEAITLKRLFLGKTDLDTLINIRDVRIESKFQRHDYIPEPVREILRRALARDPAERYQTAMEFHDAVQDYLFDQRLRLTGAEVGRLMREMFPDVPSALAGTAPPSTHDGPATPIGTPVPSPRTHPGTRRPEGGMPDTSPSSLSLRPGARRDPEPVSAPEVPMDLAAVAPERTPVGRPAAKERPRGKVAVPMEDLSGAAQRDNLSGAYAFRATQTNTGNVILRGALDLDVADSGGPDALTPVGWGIGDTGLHEATFRLRGHDGQVFGPISFPNLINLMKSRSVTEGELVSINDGEWVPAGQIAPLRRMLPEFFGRARQKPLYEGPVNHLMLPRLIYQIAVNRNSGVLKLSRGTTAKEVFFKRGRPRHITSSLKKELLGNYMVDKGLVPAAGLDEAIRRVRETGAKLGDTLIAMNIVRPYDLYRILSNQFRDKFLEVFTWTRGWYAFFEDEVPADDIIPLEVDPLLCLSEGVRQFYGLEVLERFFMDRMGRPFSQVKNRHITIDNLCFSAKERRAHTFVETATTLRDLMRKHGRTPDDRLTLFRVVFVLFQTDLLLFENDSPDVPPR
ncbi:MAG: hypothetical protein AMXMBFR64_57160 [Myxococcales bacterium]